jgi:hypothetical protein
MRRHPQNPGKQGHRLLKEANAAMAAVRRAPSRPRRPEKPQQWLQTIG